jgi:hypothetical protein
MAALTNEDLLWCLKRLPMRLRELMKKRPRQLIVAGGFIRSCVSGEAVSDVDLFSPSAEAAKTCALDMAVVPNGQPRRMVETENAITVVTKPFPLQFIHKWTYDKPEDILPSFDFTIARAAFWWERDDEVGRWCSLVDDRFYADLAAKRLVYCSPTRIELVGGSLLRVLKFYQRGYRIPLDSLGAVIARLESGVDQRQLEGHDRESQVAKVVTGLLREVDPNIDPDHVCHLPAMNAGEQNAVEEEVTQQE